VPRRNRIPLLRREWEARVGLRRLPRGEISGRGPSDIRKSSNLRFDERLPGYHMYGTDICLEARRRGMKSYVIPAFCIHNTNGYRMLPLQFWRSYLFMRKKWRSELPIATSCTEITFGCWPMIRWNMIRAANIVSGRHQVLNRVRDPSRLYLDLSHSGAAADRSSAYR
jgi:hypothetical protein